MSNAELWRQFGEAAPWICMVPGLILGSYVTLLAVWIAQSWPTRLRRLPTPDADATQLREHAHKHATWWRGELEAGRVAATPEIVEYLVRDLESIR